MAALDSQEALLATWQTSNRVTTFLVENLPDELWHRAIPGAPRRTIQMIAGHLHNCRCMWIKMLGKKHGLAVPRSVNRHRVTLRLRLHGIRETGPERTPWVYAMTHRALLLATLVAVVGTPQFSESVER